MKRQISFKDSLTIKLQKTAEKKAGRRFQERPLLKQKTIGEQLSAARQASKRNLKDLALQLKISVNYLSALESGNYNALPSPVYIKNYLRLYCQALAIPWDKMQKQYEQEIIVYHDKESWPKKEQGILQKKNQTTVPQISTNSPHHQKPVLIPRLLKFGVFGIVVFGVVVYFGFSLLRLVTPPALTIASPQADMIVSERELIISGKSVPGAVIKINGQAVAIDQDGKFSEAIVLGQGLNTIYISAKSKLSQENTIVRNVLYKETE
ncbi:MAG: hypothetical protein A2283_09195 [Lentisphaerae bacterium RIFOXYA12_FULL_48_11]|uniref:HTH cro/C1-type domain-containing protein n=1 Tax=Candidatus Kerfeldbacteria bacterium RIFOXYB2_FULL_38_14 TaxID=1798547 RepID=A0A1G2BEM2_9BACT|nr:MAG: hypothetical protein A2283_09195 [Lentisphaerae bacterium RIFOXYA12_FULL_48_11]OGY87661.1 MAG: hypothetical protein A2319_04395 [Candidatus Kerfeldbacteria bacterium RIFOXYB2_FULL_38_14]OGY87850.1 MAG: hypothetical protein A2233_01790 [Candidatus Kerfeldbacteria bacterium RIFOXYA2_FULL_38_24]OGY88511.1 MAG: hypothetical protein A2458_01955 [Candidatus Kerfeldbacteria bacterium RIFOXYC2_FULL_38_9]